MQGLVEYLPVPPEVKCDCLGDNRFSRRVKTIPRAITLLVSQDMKSVENQRLHNHCHRMRTRNRGKEQRHRSKKA